MNASSFPRPAAGPAHPVRVWIPLGVVVWLLLIPLAVIVSPIVFVAAAFWRLNPFVTVGALFALVVALAGVKVEVETPDARINLF
jgi:hypothetical protein